MSGYGRRHGAAFALYHKKIHRCSPLPFGPVWRLYRIGSRGEAPGLAGAATVLGGGTVVRNASQSVLFPQLRKRYEGNIPRS